MGHEHQQDSPRDLRNEKFRRDDPLRRDSDEFRHLTGPAHGAEREPVRARHAASHVLNRIASSSVPPIILVSGSERDFKALLKAVEDHPEGHKVEVLSHSSQDLQSSAEGVIFASRDSRGELFGITLRDVMGGVRHSRHSAKIVFVRDPVNYAVATEAIKSVVPHYPVATLALHDGHAPASRERSDLHRVLEVGSSSGAEIFPKLMSLSDASAVHHARAAMRALRPEELPNNGYPIPRSVYECLENVLLPRAEQHRLSVLLRGGCGIVSFMPGARPISEDIDFTALLPVNEFSRFVELIRDVAGEGQFEIRGDPSLDFSKRSTYVKGKVEIRRGASTDESEGREYCEVSLDAVAVRRVSHAQDLFAYEFKYDKVLNNYHHLVRLESGAELGVVAPELTLVEKLVAGRGQEADKYDILDATGIIANQPLQTHLIQRIIERQRYDGSIDSSKIHGPLFERYFRGQLEDLGLVTDGRLGSIVEREVNSRLEVPDTNKVPQVVNHILTPDTLKKAALANKLLAALEKVEADMHKVDGRLRPESSAAELWTESSIRKGVDDLREFLYGYVRDQLFREDVYVSRSARSLERSQHKNFWSFPPGTRRMPPPFAGGPAEQPES